MAKRMEYGRFADATAEPALPDDRPAARRHPRPGLALPAAASARAGRWRDDLRPLLRPQPDLLADARQPHDRPPAAQPRDGRLHPHRRALPRGTPARSALLESDAARGGVRHRLLRQVAHRAERPPGGLRLRRVRAERLPGVRGAPPRPRARRAPAAAGAAGGGGPARLPRLRARRRGRRAGRGDPGALPLLARHRVHRAGGARPRPALGALRQHPRPARPLPRPARALRALRPGRDPPPGLLRRPAGRPAGHLPPHPARLARPRLARLRRGDRLLLRLLRAGRRPGGAHPRRGARGGAGGGDDRRLHVRPRRLPRRAPALPQGRAGLRGGLQGPPGPARPRRRRGPAGRAGRQPARPRADDRGPHGRWRLPRHGRALLPLLAPAGGDAPWTDEAFAECHGQRFFYTQRTLWRDQLKYVFNGFDEDELYDLAADPHELRNLARDPAHAAVARDLAARMWAIIRETDDYNMHQAHYGMFRFAPVGPLAAGAGTGGSKDG